MKRLNDLDYLKLSKFQAFLYNLKLFIVNMYTNVLSTAELPSQVIGSYEQMLEHIAEQPEPSIFSTITSSIWSYTFLGALVGLIIAGIVKREPNIFGDEQN